MKTKHSCEDTRRNLALSCLFATLCLFVGCPNPVSTNPGGSPKAGGPTGTLVIKIPSRASWFKNEQPAPQAPAPSAAKGVSKAFATINKYTVEVLTASGSAVISPVTATPSSISGTNFSTTAITIPAGSNYTVKVSIYNTQVSTSVPTVVGQTSGVNVTANTNTNVSVTCFPLNPDVLTTNGAALSVTLASDGEHWYTVTLNAGTSYYFLVGGTSGSQACIFDPTGSYISSGPYISLTPTSSGTYYIALVGYGGVSTIQASTTPPTLNEGSAVGPVPLTLNTAHLFKAGPSGSQDTSYYSFTTTSAGSYALDTAEGYYSAQLYSDPAFSALVSSSSYLNYGTIFTGLSASTTYYLALKNDYNSFLSTTGQIVDPATISASTASEGTTASPVTLTVDSTWTTGKVGAHSYNMNSYYAFTTGAGMDYRLSLSSITPSATSGLDVGVYSNSSFSNEVDYFYCPATSGASDLFLSPSTTYYIVVSNTPTNDNLIYSMEVSTVTPTFTALAPGDSWTSGSIDSSGDPVWYMATVTPGATYTVNLANSEYEGTGDNYTAWCSVSAYKADRSTSYFTNIVNCYSSNMSKVITVPSGENTLYILVSGNSGTFALKLSVPPPNGKITISLQ